MTASRRRINRLLAVVAVVLVVVVARVALGVWPTSVGLAAVGLWSGLRAWARMEARSRRSASGEVVPAEAHVAFARALAEVAAAYLAECEREADRP